jgi:predicted transcriptional regulator
MPSWNFLTNHGGALLCIAHDPDVRLREIASALGITERRAHTIVNDLEDAGYVLKERDGRRNRYLLGGEAPLLDAPSRLEGLAEILEVLSGGA